MFFMAGACQLETERKPICDSSQAPGVGCVECFPDMESMYCTDPERPLCELDEQRNTYFCSEGPEDCVNSGCDDPLRPICNVRSGLCSPCTSEGECPQTSPLCEPNGSCVGCDTNSDCQRFTEARVCHPITAACVECTESDNSACDSGRNVCDRSSGTCTSFEARTKAACDPCVYDEECIEGQVCASGLNAGTFPSDSEAYCVWRRMAATPGGPNGDCTSIRPFSATRVLTTATGEAMEICAPSDTTCSGIESYRTPCDGAVAPAYSVCGLPQERDAFCVEDEGAFRCSVLCSTASLDCPTDPDNRECDFRDVAGEVAVKLCVAPDS